MEKYAVEIDPEKVEKEKVAGKGQVNDPNTNIPIDPVRGSEPFEKKKKDEDAKG